MDVFKEFQGQEEDIPWGAGAKGADQVEIAFIEDHLRKKSKYDRWSIRGGAESLIFCVTEPHFDEDGNYTFGYFDGGIFWGVGKSTALVTTETQAEIIKCISRDDNRGVWVLVGFRSDTLGYLNPDKGSIVFSKWAFYWWWRLGGLKAISSVPIFPLVFKEMTEEIAPMINDLRSGVDDKTLLARYKGRISQAVLDALRAVYDLDGGNSATAQDHTPHEEKVTPIVKREGLEDRLRKVLTGLATEEEIEQIFTSLPKWLEKRTNNPEYKPWFTACLLASATMSKTGIKEGTSLYQREAQKIAVEVCEKTGAKSSGTKVDRIVCGTDTALVMRAIRHSGNLGGAPKKNRV